MSDKNRLKISDYKTQLEINGHIILRVPLNYSLEEIVLNKDYLELDKYFQKETLPEGLIFKTLSQFCAVKKIEFIISLREAQNEWEEDGIWHDDGSRILAFSLSLTKEPPMGGFLGLRIKGSSKVVMIPTPAYGDMIIFKTGVDNFEHKIHSVTSGSRLIIAGWCYS